MPPGIQVKDPFAPPIGPQDPTALFGNPATFSAAAKTQASDYDRIMAQYADLAKSYASNPLIATPVSSQNVQAPGSISPNSVSANPIAPQTSKYEQSGDVTGSLSNLSNLAATGGYSEADKADIRARDISSIRSIYANAQQNAERQRALSGGYSPNFNAVQAQMARDEANKIGDVTTAANAGIAQNVASNRISASGTYAGASSRANEAKTAADQRNADIINQANQLNEQNRLQTGEFNASQAADLGKFNTSVAQATAENNANRNVSTQQFNTQAALDAAKTSRSGALGAVQGQASLYGTTPALTSTFGNQVVQANQMDQGQQQLNKQKLDAFGRPATYFG